MGTPDILAFKPKKPDTHDFVEKKDTTVYMHEPLKFKVKSFANGHTIEWTANMAWDQVDHMMDKQGAIVQGILNTKKLIEGPMESRVLSVETNTPIPTSKKKKSNVIGVVVRKK